MTTGKRKKNIIDSGVNFPIKLKLKIYNISLCTKFDVLFAVVGDRGQGAVSFHSLPASRGQYFTSSIPPCNQTEPPRKSAERWSQFDVVANRGITISISVTWCYAAQKYFFTFTHMGRETSVTPWINVMSVQTSTRWLVSLSGFIKSRTIISSPF